MLWYTLYVCIRQKDCKDATVPLIFCITLAGYHWNRINEWRGTIFLKKKTPAISALRSQEWLGIEQNLWGYPGRVLRISRSKKFSKPHVVPPYNSWPLFFTKRKTFCPRFLHLKKSLSLFSRKKNTCPPFFSNIIIRLPLCPSPVPYKFRSLPYFVIFQWSMQVFSQCNILSYFC